MYFCSAGRISLTQGQCCLGWEHLLPRLRPRPRPRVWCLSFWFCSCRRPWWRGLLGCPEGEPLGGDLSHLFCEGHRVYRDLQLPGAKCPELFDTPFRWSRHTWRRSPMSCQTPTTLMHHRQLQMPAFPGAGKLTSSSLAARHSHRWSYRAVADLNVTVPTDTKLLDFTHFATRMTCFDLRKPWRWSIPRPHWWNSPLLQSIWYLMQAQQCKDAWTIDLSSLVLRSRFHWWCPLDAKGI